MLRQIESSRGVFGVSALSGAMAMLVVLALSASALPAQVIGTGEVTLTGSVSGWSTRVALVDAEVLLLGTDRTTTVDASGRFALQDVKPGVNTLRVSRRGFVTQEVEVAVTDSMPSVHVRLHPSSLPSPNADMAMSYSSDEFSSSDAPNLCELLREVQLRGNPTTIDDVIGATRTCRDISVEEVHQIDAYQCGFKMTGLVLQGAQPRRPQKRVRVYTKEYVERQAISTRPYPSAPFVC